MVADIVLVCGQNFYGIQSRTDSCIALVVHMGVHIQGGPRKQCSMIVPIADLTTVCLARFWSAPLPFLYRLASVHMHVHTLVPSLTDRSIHSM